MTFAQALQQATARWGGRALVSEQVSLDAQGRTEVLRLVGFQRDPWAWAVLGMGASWAEAFREADRCEGGTTRT
jgi:hypothetical protein